MHLERTNKSLALWEKVSTAPLARSDVLPCWQRQPFCRWQKRQTSVLVTNRGCFQTLSPALAGALPKGEPFLFVQTMRLSTLNAHPCLPCVKGGGAACRDGGIVKKFLSLTPQSLTRFAGAPFTQGSLFCSHFTMRLSAPFEVGEGLAPPELCSHKQYGYVP